MNKLITYLLIAVSIFSLAGCGQGKEASQPEKTEKTITIGVMPDVESIPFLIAEKNGYYAQRGVNVKIEHFKSAKDRDSALQSGKLDGMVSDMVAAVFANEGGIKLKIIAKNDGNILLMGGKDSGIGSTSDLKGRSVGLSTNTIMEYTADRMLEGAGIKAEDIKKQAIPQLPTRLEMLQGNKIDAAILPYPLAGLAIKDGAKVLNSTDQMGNKAGVIVFTEASLKQSPNEVKAVVQAYNDAVAYLAQEPVDNYIDYVIEEQGFPEGTKNVFALPAYTEAQLPDEKIFNDVVQWMQNKNLIKGNYTYQDMVDGNFLR